LVEKIKASVAGAKYIGNFRTIECCIMDLADDIAYSTYDLEDAFKNGFLSAISMLSLDDIKKRKRDKLPKKLAKR
jgi:dGTPase